MFLVSCFLFRVSCFVLLVPGLMFEESFVVSCFLFRVYCFVFLVPGLMFEESFVIWSDWALICFHDQVVLHLWQEGVPVPGQVHQHGLCQVLRISSVIEGDLRITIREFRWGRIMVEHECLCALCTSCLRNRRCRGGCSYPPSDKGGFFTYPPAFVAEVFSRRCFRKFRIEVLIVVSFFDVI